MRNLKKILALVLALVMSFSVMSVAGAAYADQDAVDASAYKTALEVLSAIKVLEGDTEGNLNPEKTITRGEVATIIYRIHSGDVDKELVEFYESYTTTFTDLDWSAAYVNYCAKEGLVKGYNDTTFAPKDEVTGYQVLAMILRAIGYDANGEFTGSNWKTEVAVRATKLGLLKGIKAADLAAPATRALVAELVFRTMDVEKVALNKDTGAYVGTETTLNAEFGLTAADTTIVKRDEWGRAYSESGWYLGNKWIEATYSKNFDEKLASFNTFVKADDLKKVDEKLLGDAIDVYTNGAAAAVSTKAGIGGQGVAIELYNSEKFGTYIVVINTTLAKVTAVDTKKETVTLDLVAGQDEDGKDVYMTIPGTYAKGTYLVTEFNKNLKAGNTGFRAVEAAQIKTAVLSRVADGQYIIEGVKATKAANFVNYVGDLKNGTKYNWIYDEQGNLIAVDAYVAPAEETPEAAAPVYVVVLGAQDMTGNVGFGGTSASYEIKANVLYLGETEYKTVNLAGYYNGKNDKGEIQVVPFDATHGFVVNKTYTTGMHGDLYEVVATDKNGALILNAVDTKVDTTPDVEGKEYATYKKGTQMIKGELVNNKTVFAFLDAKNGTAKYVTGYTNVETFNAKAEDVLYMVDEKTGFVTYVYVSATVVEEVKVEDKYATTDAYYYLTNEAYVDWATLTLHGLVDMNGEAATLNVEKSFAADIYNTLTEMIDLYAGTILKVTTTTKNGELFNTEIASAMATGTSYEVKNEKGEVVKTVNAQYMAEDAYELVDGLLIVNVARAQLVLNLNDVKNIVDQDGNKVDVAELYNLKGNLYVVFSGDTVETIVVTKVTAKSLAEKFEASLEKVTAEAILADVDSKLLTYTVGSDVDAYTATLINAIKNSTALNVVAMSGNVVDVKVEINVATLTGKAIVVVEGIEKAIEIELTIKEK